MNPLLFMVLLITFVFAGELTSHSQTAKQTYLIENSYNLKAPSDKPFSNKLEQVKIYGFGAYHGSQKTEDAEFALLNQLEGIVKYYLPEVDYATALYFNSYIDSGDDDLLKDLVLNYGYAVPQDGSVATFNKWKKLREYWSNKDNERVIVLGTNTIGSLKYTCKFLIEKAHDQLTEAHVKMLVQLLENNHTQWQTWSDSPAMDLITEIHEDHQSWDKEKRASCHDRVALRFVMESVGSLINKTPREEAVLNHYVSLGKSFDFEKNVQFFRYGFFHLEKTKEQNSSTYPSFFTRLIEQNIYLASEICSVIGYLTKSAVLWGKKYHDTGSYKGYTTKGGFGIGDCWRERFEGIKSFKKVAQGRDLILFDLTTKDSPYREMGCTDMIQVNTPFGKSNPDLKAKATSHFLDYVLLISNSEASVPIESVMPLH